MLQQNSTSKVTDKSLGFPDLGLIWQSRIVIKGRTRLIERGHLTSKKKSLLENQPGEESGALSLVLMKL